MQYRSPRPRKAATRAPVTKTADTGTQQSRMGRVINGAWAPLQEYAGSEQARRLLGARDVEGFLNTAPWADFITKLGAVTAPMANVISDAIIGEYVTLGNARVGVDMKAVDALSVKYAQSQGSKLIRSITESQRAAVRAVMGGALEGQYTGDKAARLIRDTVGLHPAWAQAVVNQRERVYQNAIAAGKAPAVAEGLAEKASQRYGAKLLRRRADNIARTEILTSENLGRFASWADQIGQGYGRADDEKEWDAETAECCDRCRELHGERVQWDQPFSNGRMMPPAHVGCRCAAHKTSKLRQPGEAGYDPELDDPNHLYQPGYERNLTPVSYASDVPGIRVQVGAAPLAVPTPITEWPTAAARPDFTHAALMKHSEDDLMEMIGKYGDDPDALDAIFAAIDAKAEAGVAVTEATNADVWGSYDAYLDKTPVSPARKLTRDEQVAEQYDAYVSTQYARALDYTAGNFIKASMREEAAARGITSESLFTGPVATARKFASEELISFWEESGRQTFTSYRYHMFQMPADRKAAETVRRAGFQGTLGATSDRSTF